MLKNIQKFNRLIPLQKPPLQENYSTMTYGKIKKNSIAAQKLNTDDNNSHVKRLKNTCYTEHCEKRKCANLCGPLKKIEADGHFTHKPMTGKFSRFISEEDVNGNNDKQYYTKNSDKSKQIDATDVKPGDIKEKLDFVTYVKKHGTKFED